MDEELKYIKFLNDLYKMLRYYDFKILEHFNCEEISDNDYFLYGIKNEIVSNAIHVIMNYLSGEIVNSPGVDISCRNIIEAFTILKMNDSGDISDLQKKIYRYSYTYVDANNFHADITNNEKYLNDRRVCKEAILEHFNCEEKDLENTKIQIGDPCFYLKKKLKEKIKFHSYIKKYYPNDVELLQLYNIFSIYLHPRCEMDLEFEKNLSISRKLFIKAIISKVYQYLKDNELIIDTSNINGFEIDFYKNPVLKNSIYNINELYKGFNLLKYRICNLPDGVDYFTMFFLNQIKYMLCDMEIAISLGYKEHVVSSFKTFMEYFSVYHSINTYDQKNFNYLKIAYQLTSRLQILEAVKKIKINVDDISFDNQLSEIYENYYKNRFNLNDKEKFFDDMKNNSFYFLVGDKKNFNKIVRECINDMFGGQKVLDDELTILYDFSKDLCHASGYAFNSTIGVLDTLSHRALLGVYTCLNNFLIHVSIAMNEHNVSIDLKPFIDFTKIIAKFHYDELENQFSKINN